MKRIVWVMVCAGSTLAGAGTAFAAAAGGVQTADALAGWLGWIVVYLAIGLVLGAIATAFGLRERRAWSELLDFAADDATTTSGEADDVAAAVGSDRAA
jgi:hypothetical protein